jgi:squalene cyclase
MIMNRRAPRLAAEYLFCHAANDMWTDFLTRAGESDAWATAFVSLYLLRGGTRPEALRDAAHQLVARQGPCGGWGYNARVPADADSTACCVRAIHAILPAETAAIDAGRAYLSQHRRPTGYRTYSDAALIRAYVGVDAMVPMHGWCERAHACVTASAVLARAAPPSQAAPALRDMQRADGSWRAYWWCTAMYPTVLATEALHAGGTDDRACVAAGLEWIARAQRRDGAWDGGDGDDCEGGAFVTGLALLALGSRMQYHDAVARGIRWLRDHQRADGAWDPCPILQIPPPWVSDPASVPVWKRGGLGTPARIADQHRLFTTAVCYAAFNASPGGDHG